MAYLREHYSFPREPQQPVIYYPPGPYRHYSHPHQPQQDRYYPGYAQAEYADFAHHGGMHDDYDEGGEVSTRPRLTKEQVEILEAQFQAHPKPNSMIKKQLASQTQLTLPRVANWFQNRRAKAKQQRKQEEFEIKQSMGQSQGWRSEEELDTFDQIEAGATYSQPLTTSASPDPNEGMVRASSMPAAATDPSREASWASLQRALTAAQAARRQEVQDREPSLSCMRPPVVPRQPSSQPSMTDLTHNMSQSSFDPLTDWSSTTDSTNDWSTTQIPESIPFDFGFDQPQDLLLTPEEDNANVCPDPLSSHGYAVPVEEWLQQPLKTPTLPRQYVSDFDAIDHSPGMPYPPYNADRRGSTSDDLAATFGNFALTGTAPTRPPVPAVSETRSNQRFEGEIDLAARRKRPRPAALGSAALRSRSYGALSSMSPTLRSSTSIPHPNVIRHVKSTGHSLNARFAGVRKTSSAQRSPMNMSTFADAEAFNQLIAQQSIAARPQHNSPSSGTATPFLSPETIGTSQLPLQRNNALMGFNHDIQHQYPSHPMQQLHPLMTSPPPTPFKADYILQSQGQLMMPPVSAPPQYASLPEYTPPYSAGPLTSGSWSDAPLMSPDFPSFPPVGHIASLTLSPQQAEPSVPQFQHFRMPPDPKVGTSPISSPDTRRTEFFIQEFPGQKEEHAHVAQQLAQQKPKSYVFANATPNDYEG